MNKKGQALVEFIIVIPVLVLLLLAIVDYARILQTRSSLESVMEDVITLENYALPDNLKLGETTNDGEKSYSLKEKIELYSPFLTVIMDNPYTVEVTRVVYEEE